MKLRYPLFESLLLQENGELANALRRLDRNHVRYWRNCTVTELPYNKRSYNKFKVRGNKPWSEPWQTVWLYRPDEAASLEDQHARASCSCNSWRFNGSDWNAIQDDYILFGARSNGSSPDIRDPNRKNTVCKHVYAMLNHLRLLR